MKPDKPLPDEWKPFGTFEPLRRSSFGSVFSSDFALGGSSYSGIDWAPLVDIFEDDDEFIIKADLPETKKQDVKVTVDNRILTISGERRIRSVHKSKRVHCLERSSGRYSRSFHLSSSVDVSRLRAHFSEGVLTIHLPKDLEKVSPAVNIEVR